MRSDKQIVELCSDFVLLRLTYLRGANIAIFDYDYDLTWMSFFLDADGRVISRYGSRSSASADSHNTSAGLLNTMREVLAVHKEESAKPKTTYVMPKQQPSDIPAYNRMYGNSCGRCHMLNEAKWEQQRADGTMKPGAFFLFPLPENIGITLDLTRGNQIKAIKPDSFAQKANLKVNDTIRFANGVRILTCADMQHVLNKLEPESTLTLEIERKGRPLKALVELSGDWRASDVSWRKSIRMRAFNNNFTRHLVALPATEKDRLGIDREQIAYRLTDSKGEVQEAGLMKNDVIVAMDGKRLIPYRVPHYYPFIDHKSGDMMEVTVLRDGKERTLSLRVP